MGCVHSNANPIESAIASSKHKDNYVTNLEKPTSSSYIISPSINDKNDNEVTEGCSTPTTPITQSRKASLRSLAVSSSCEKPIPSLTVETLQVSWYNTPNPSQKGSPVIDNSSNDNNCAIETSGITKKFSYDDIRDTIPPTCPQTLSNLLSQADCADLTGLELTEEGSSRNSQFSVDDVRDTIPPTRGGCAMSALGSTGVAELEEDEEESDGIRDTIPPTRGFAMPALSCSGIAELEEDEEESDGIRDTIPPTRGGFAMSALGCTGIAELEEDEEESDGIRDTIPPTRGGFAMSALGCTGIAELEVDEGESDGIRDTIPPTRGGFAISALGCSGIAELEEDEEESDGIRDTIPPTRGGFAMSALGCTGIAELEEDEEGLALLTTSTVVTPSLEVIAEGDTEVLKPPVANEVNDSDISIVQAPDGEIVFEEVEKEEVWLVLMATVASVCTVNG